MAAPPPPRLLLHDLRRSRARLWSQRGVPDPVAMRLGHWATRSVYDRYRIVADTDMREALARAAAAEQPAPLEGDRRAAPPSSPPLPERPLQAS